jgi:hypothetical protein
MNFLDVAEKRMWRKLLQNMNENTFTSNVWMNLKTHDYTMNFRSLIWLLLK